MYRILESYKLFAGSGMRNEGSRLGSDAHAAIHDDAGPRRETRATAAEVKGRVGHLGRPPEPAHGDPGQERRFKSGDNLHGCLDHGGVCPAWADAVDADMMGDVVDGCSPRDAQDGVLGGRVLHHAGDANVRRDGGHVHHAPAGEAALRLRLADGDGILGLHGGRHDTSHEEGAVDVDVDQPLKVGHIGLGHCVKRPSGDTGRVNRVIDTTESLGCFGNGAFDRLQVAHINVNRPCLKFGVRRNGLDLLGSLLGRLEVDVGDNNPARALLCKGEAARLADATR
jgi:hypothetical protein